MIQKNFILKISVMCLLVCLFSSFAWSGYGYASTNTKPKETSITIPIEQWDELKQELTMQESELMQFRQEFQKLKKPSEQLRMQLEKAENLLNQSQAELQNAKNDLTALRKDKEELEILLQTLKQDIDKERKIQKRKNWQNRIWCFLGGVAIGCAVK